MLGTGAGKLCRPHWEALTPPHSSPRRGGTHLICFFTFKVDPYTPSHCDLRAPLALWSMFSEKSGGKGDEHRLCSHIPALLFTHCVTSGKLLSLLGLCFPFLWTGDNTHLILLLLGVLKEILYVSALKSVRQRIDPYKRRIAIIMIPMGAILVTE